MPTIGSQSLVRVLPRTRYDFGALAGGEVTIPVAQHVHVLGYDRAALQVRVHDARLPEGSSVTVRLADDGFSADEPGSHFLQTTAGDGSEIGSVTLTAETRLPFYQSVSTKIPGVVGRLMAVLVTFQVTPVVGGNRYALVAWLH